MNRKEKILDEIKKLNATFKHKQAIFRNANLTGGSLVELGHHKDELDNINKKIKNLKLEIYNTQDAKNNMYQIMSFIDDLIPGRLFMMDLIESVKFNDIGKYKYLIKFNHHIDHAYFKKELIFLKDLYNAEIYVDERKIEVNIFPNYLDKELLTKDNFGNYKKSIVPIKKYAL